MKVDRYVEPVEFDQWKKVAEDMGFLYVASGPLVRSSYKVRQCPFLPYVYINQLGTSQAGEFYIENVLRGKGSEKKLKVLTVNDKRISSEYTT